MVAIYSTTLLLVSVGAALTGDEAIRRTFDRMVTESGLIYTPEEFAQHFNDFTSRLSSKGLAEGDLTTTFRMARPVLVKSVAREINENQSSWVASADQPRFEGASLEDAATLCGTIIDGPVKLPQKERMLGRAEPPKNFDAREHFQDCAHVIGNIRDQSTCGSCWAFATSEAFNDRLCIKSGGQFNHVPMSAGHTLACCSMQEGCMSFGCNGGQPASAWQWFHSKGVVSGGGFQKSSSVESFDESDAPGCWPYDFPECSHHVDVKGMEPCKGNKDTPKCVSTCHNQGFHTDFEQDRHYTETEGVGISDVDEIKRELMENGPVSAAFTVYDDFPLYKSGVYHHTTGAELGGHAVKVIGWGVEGAEDYWLVVNSWNSNWGDNGLFKIRMGDCGIDSDITAGTPRVKHTLEVIFS